MDVLKCTSLLDHLKTVPDPRDPRGVRHQWWVILAICCAALLAGQQDYRMTARWARNQRRLLARYLPLRHGLPPSMSTFQRAWAQVDLDALEAAAEHYITPLTEPDEDEWTGLAIDGKTVRGASKYGRKVHLLAAVDHRSGLVRRQRNVHEKTNEIPEAHALLAGWDLTGAVVTADALHCQRALSEQIRRQGGHYLFQVKDNQPELHRALQDLFADPRSGPHPLTFWKTTSVGKGHGRVEARFLEATAALNEYLDWPGLGQAIHRVCGRRLHGRDTTEDHYWVTSLTHAEAPPADLERHCRAHWMIENRPHYIRDVTFGEDASTIRQGHAPQARAALLNMVTALIVSRGYRYTTDALCDYQCNPARALQHMGCRRL